jgi:hypothetical protein
MPAEPTVLPSEDASAAGGRRGRGFAHAAEPDVYLLSHTLADQCRRHPERLRPFVDRYGTNAPSEPDRLHSELFRAPAAAGWGCCGISRTCT